MNSSNETTESSTDSATPAPEASFPDEAALAAFEAPRVDPATRLFASSLTVGRQALFSVLLPFLKQQTDKAVDPEELKLPLENLEKAILNKNLSRLGQEYDDSDIPEIPRVRASDISPAEVQRLARKTPIVFEGFAPDSEVLKEWSLDYLRQKHGDAKLWVHNPDLTEYRGNLGELLDELIAGEETGKYVQGAADLFLQNPELEKALPLDVMREYIGELGRHFSTEMFVGGPNTGSPFHCAPFFNFFIMVHGVKDWIFIHPSYSMWMYPFLQVTGFAISPIRHKLPKEELDAKFPLYRRVAKKKVRLHPGDVLLNPPWWWHAVDNISPSSIGVATRWVEPKITEFNRFFELASLLCKPARVVHKQAKRGGRLNDSIWRELFHLKPTFGRSLISRG